MITKITHFTLFVKDQDEALKFYTEKFGFKVHTDATMEGGMRWLTLHPNDQKDMELVLSKAENDEQKKLIGKQAADHILFCFETNNCEETYKDLKSKNVKILQEPTQAPWGINIICEDLYGNKIFINQPIY